MAPLILTNPLKRVVGAPHSKDHKTCYNKTGGESSEGARDATAEARGQASAQKSAGIQTTCSWSGSLSLVNWSDATGDCRQRLWNVLLPGRPIRQACEAGCGFSYP